MKRLNKLKILGAVLIVLLIGTFAATKIQDHTEKIKNGGGKILELNAEEVNSISWDTGSGTLSFHKEDDKWVYDDDEDFPVSSTAINMRISDFADFEVTFTIEDADDPAQYGLEDPECTINISTDDEDYVIKLGDYSSVDEQRYVSIGDGNVYLAETDIYTDFDVSVDSLMQDDEIPYSFGEDVKVSFEGAFEYGFGYTEDNKYTGCSDDVYFTSVKHLALDTAKVSSYLDDISSIGLGSCMTYKAADEDLEKYGLDDPEIKVTIEYKDSDDEEQTLSFIAGRKPKDRDVEREDIDESTDAYFMMDGSTMIYEISGTDLANILAGSYSDLRHDDIFTSDTDDVYKMEVTLDGKDYTFTSKGSGDDKKWYLDDEEAEDAGDIVDALGAINASEYTDSADTGKEEISIKVYMKNKNVSEMSYTFYRNDGETCTAEINGAVSCTVERSLVVDLAEAVNEVIL